MDPARDEILEVAAVHAVAGRPVAVFNRFIRPAGPLPLKIRRLTGIRPEDVAGAPPAGEVLADLVALLASVGHQIPLVLHHAPFDLGFLEAHLARAGLAMPAGPVLDTLDLARILWPRARSHRLSEACRLAEVALAEAHRAGDDALATALLFFAQQQRLQELDLESLERMAALLPAAVSPLGAMIAEALGARVRRLEGPARRRPVATWAQRLASAAPARQHPRPLDRDDLRAVFLPGGALSRSMEAYEHRHGQLKMMDAVADALADGHHLLVEAGTGTGKSLAYLIPAIAWALETGRRVVVSTHTINLQEQLWEKDLPLVRQATGLDFRAALLKGKGNYLCLRKWEGLVENPEPLGPAERLFHVRLLNWLAETETGDRSELNLFGPQEDLWRAVSAEHESCTAANCPRHAHCFMVGARAAAESAHLVVVNHSLLFSDLQSGGRVLPEYHALVVDEAHHLQDVASRHLGKQVSVWEVRRWVSGLGWGARGRAAGGRRAPGPLALWRQRLQGVARAGLPARDQEAADRCLALVDAALAQLDDVDAALEELIAPVAGLAMAWSRDAEGGGESLTLRLRPEHAAAPEWEAVAAARDNAAGRLLRLAGRLADLGAVVEDWDGAGALGLRRVTDDAAGLAALAREHGEAMSDLLDPGEPEAEPATVRWVEVAVREGWSNATLCSAPIHVGDTLRRQLWERLGTAILTSATLTVAGRFDHLMRQLGFSGWEPGRVETVVVESPLQYRRQALVCIPQGLPVPGPRTDAAYVTVLADFLHRLVRATGGRTLVLFTSHRLLQEVYSRLREPLEQDDLCLLAQGIDGSRFRLLEEFKERGRTVLFGSASFWEGVDVPGEALSCVVIVRLPFSPPTQPLVAARLEDLERRGLPPFQHLTLPEAVLRFKQGFGRLIRTQTDRGVVVVVDPRVADPRYRYGARFLESLPGPSLFRGPAEACLAEISRWLQGPAPGVRWVTPGGATEGASGGAEEGASGGATGTSGGAAGAPGAARPR